MLILPDLFNKIIVITAKVAPVIFAKTSNTPALLVDVKSACSNSIPIPNKQENPKEMLKGFGIVVLFKCFWKNKNQSDVNTKWKKE